MDLAALQRTAVKAAFQGAVELRNHFGKLDTVTKKGRIDLVTQADLASEAKIIAVIRSHYPDHDVLAEESGASGGGNSAANLVRWVIDPLDGTTNYAHGLPIFAISIAVEVDTEALVGVVLNPNGGELFSAIKAHGALLNDRPIRVSRTDAVSESLLITGFPYEWGDQRTAIIERFSRCVDSARGIRRLGAAALDLCYVAAGRADAYWEAGLKPWDSAAGALIAREAGAMVTDFSGREYTDRCSELLASNSHIHTEMLSLLQIAKETR
ncbi:MAG: inositol monophosphatase family protein [Desulfosarcinaceae bacterium]|nr:inositol monophosphatase family protein [Desulfosarcinaceae bacterium]